MRYRPNGRFLLVVMLGISLSAWGQGGRGRGSAAQAGGATQAGAPGGGGGRSGPLNFYDYDTAAAGRNAIPDVPPAETRQKIMVGGEAVAYTARAGFLPLHNPTTGQSEAHLFFTYYARDGAGDAASRPVMFFLGGAPGVATAWQEFGGFGPKRMKWAADGTAGTPPYGWEENPNTLLGRTDLVFVNPVGTAYSRPDQPGRGPEFWTSANDVASLAAFVRTFLQTYGRVDSPLLLAGEDFATGRAAGLAVYLEEHSIPVRGVVLLSMTPAADALAGDEQYITLLPSLALTSWVHKKLTPDLASQSAAQVAEQARQFASREYLHALYKGSRMTEQERGRVTASLSRMTGLSQAFLVNNDLRITLDRYKGELLRDEHRAPSSSDARVTLYVPGAGGRGGRGGRGGGTGAASVDYAVSGLSGGFLAAYEDYLKRELSFADAGNSIFYLLSGGVGSFTSNGNDSASLTGAFARNPDLHLFVGMSLYDLDAPFYATEFTLAQLDVSPQVRAHNIMVTQYEAGRMAYLDSKSLARLQTDLVRFINQSLSQPGR